MLTQCAVIEGGARCEDKAYTTVRDPTTRDATPRDICRRHFNRAYQRAEMFIYARSRRRWQKAEAA